MTMQQLYHIIQATNGKEDCLLATVMEGSHAGEKLLLCGGEQVAASPFLQAHLREVSSMSDSGLITLEGQRVFVERFGGRPHLVLCGAGTVGQALLSLCRGQDFRVTVLEDREEYGQRAKELGAQEVLCQSFEEALTYITGSPSTYFVVVTREHRYDTQCLRQMLQKPNAYIGMMGSRRRTSMLKEQLKEEGFDPAQVEAIHAPIGLAIEAETPEEIAVSILAELIQCKNRQKRTEGYRPELLEALREGTTPCVLTQIVDRRGSTPRGIGTKMLVYRDGTHVGSIGGGWMEAEVIRQSVALLNGQERTCLMPIELLSTGEDLANPMLCGGTQLVYMEKMEHE